MPAKKGSRLNVVHGQRHHSARHSNDTVERCRQLDDDGVSRADISRKTGVPPGTLSGWLNYSERMEG